MTQVRTLNVLVERDTVTDQVTIKLDGAGPWINLTGLTSVGATFVWDAPARGGSFTARGMGTYSGFSGVEVTFQGSISASGLVGTLSVGSNGALPTRQPIVYSVQARRQ